METSVKRFFRHWLLNFVKITGYLPFGAFFKPHLYYEKEDTPKIRGGEIVICNHTTLMDYAILLFVYKFRVIRVLMAEVLFKKKLLAWFLKRLQGIRVDRQNGTSVEWMDEAKQALMDQDAVGIFPEGRLNKEGRDYGPLLPFNKGAVRLAMETGALIRPIYTHTQGGFTKSTGVLVGHPIDIQRIFGNNPTPEAMEKANRFLKRRMEEMRDDLKNRDQHREHSLLTRHIRWSIGLALRMGYGIHFHYTDEQVQGKKLKENVIIVSNHSSWFDPPMLCAIFPKDRVHILAGEVLFEKKGLGFLLNRLGCIKVDRTRLDMESFHTMTDVLRKKRSVGIFPEGQLSENKEIQPFKSSFVLAAINSNVKVLPICIGGEYKLFKKRLHIWIDTPMEMKGDSLTVESIEDQALQVENRMKYLKEQLEKEMEKRG